MLKKEAEKIVGGLTRTSKMPCPSYNITARGCLTGSKLVNIPGSVCHGCYALKNRYVMPVQAAAGERRLKAIEDPRWVQAMITLIKGHKYFRWHDSGDIQSMQHLENIFRICRATPETKHWIPTREAQFLKRLKLKQVPRNLVIRMSSHMVDQGPVTFWPWTSTVVSDKTKKTCPAPEQENQCKDCRSCWDREVPTVAYGKH